DVFFMEISSAHVQATHLKFLFDYYKSSAVRYRSISFSEINTLFMTRLDMGELPLELNDDNVKEVNPLRQFIQLHLSLTMSIYCR
ncbi:MAG: hypothetical protein EXX96DRAFT_492441, partial [Benjaminiella poitrasii]